MTSETRYMRSDTWSAGIYKLGTSRTASATSVSLGQYPDNPVTQYFGVRVYVYHSDGTRDEVTSGVTLITSGTSGLLNGSWACPQMAISDTDAIEVEVYADNTNPPTIKRATFRTEALNATQLDSATWQLYFYLQQSYNPRTRVYSYTFWWGTQTYDTRIENFSWSTEGPAPSNPPILVQIM